MVGMRSYAEMEKEAAAKADDAQPTNGEQHAAAMPSQARLTGVMQAVVLPQPVDEAVKDVGAKVD